MLTLAHGFGGRGDVPVPVTFFVAGVGLVLVVWSVVLSVTWKRPRLQDGPLLRPPAVRTPAVLWSLGRAVGVAGLVLAVGAGVTAMVRGTDFAGGRNIAPVLSWVGFALAIPLLSGLAGNIYAAINPWRTMAG